jgi:hypothetical protein
MSFYLREGISVGPVNFNFSKSGVGASIGVEGFRLGAGPKGAYVHVGKNPIRYRKYKQFGSSKPGSKAEYDTSQKQDDQKQDEGQDYGDQEYLEDPEDADATSLVEVESEGIIEEINDARDRWRLWPVLALVSVGTVPFSLVAAGIGVLATVFAYQRDKVRKTVALLYDFEGEKTKRQYEQACKSFKFVLSSDQVVSAEAKFSSPTSVKTNIPIPSLSTEDCSFYFFPELLMVENGNGISGIPYDHAAIEKTYGKAKLENPPEDIRVLGSEWKHSNKDGGKDKRYDKNPKVYEVMYEVAKFSARYEGSEYEIEACFSRKGSANKLKQMMGTWLPVKFGEEFGENKDKSEIQKNLSETFRDIRYSLSYILNQDPDVQSALQKFRSLEEGKQISLIERVEEEDESTANILKKAYRMQRRSDSIKEKSKKVRDTWGGEESSITEEELERKYDLSELDTLEDGIGLLEEMSEEEREFIVENTENSEAFRAISAKIEAGKDASTIAEEIRGESS